MVYVRANIEDPSWVSEVLGDGARRTRESPDNGLDGGGNNKNRQGNRSPVKVRGARPVGRSAAFSSCVLRKGVITRGGKGQNSPSPPSLPCYLCRGA